MRRLILLRHAKAEAAQAGKPDDERALDARGRRDARAVGAYMARHSLAPGRALVSSATRTRETWELVGESLPDVPVSYEDRLYDATPDDIQEVIGEAKDTLSSLLVVGHNPGIQALAVSLVGAGDIEMRQKLQEKFPTGGLAIVDFVVRKWVDLRPHAGRLERFVSPRSLSASVD